MLVRKVIAPTNRNAATTAHNQGIEFLSTSSLRCRQPSSQLWSTWV